MNEEIVMALEKLRLQNIIMRKAITCGKCMAFTVRNDEYYCLLKPFYCDASGHPATVCPKPLTRVAFKKIKNFL